MSGSSLYVAPHAGLADPSACPWQRVAGLTDGVTAFAVHESTVAEIDRRASDLGVSRNEYLRRWLDTEIRAEQPVTAEDLRRVSRLARDLADPDVMREAWS